MGALYPDFKCWARGQSVETGELVYGNYVQVVVDSRERPHVYEFPRNANSGNRAYTPCPTEVKAGTVQRYTDLFDFSGSSIYEGDTVEIPTGQRGKVCFELGTWGVGICDTDGINWNEAERLVTKMNGNSPHFLYNDNFISFYELIDNFCPEDACDNKCSAVCNVSGHPSWLEEFKAYYKG